MEHLRPGVVLITCSCSRGKLEIEMGWGHFPIEYEIKPDKYVKINVHVYVSFKTDLHNYF